MRRLLPRLACQLLLVLLGLAPLGVAAAAADSPACPESIPAVYERVSPAVVAIAASTINPYQPGERVTRIAGSGVIFDASGLVLTNAHVVLGRQTVIVTLDDGTTVPAQGVGIDPILDVAVIRITPPKDTTLSVASFGKSERLKVGEEVLAIGNPMGLEQTLTRGVVSGLNRILPETPFSTMEPLIQTDTPINPGNSGGPLLNRCGEVIGVNTAILADAQNIGFAIPIDLVTTVLPSLLQHGRIVRPWLGLQGQIVGPELKALLRVPLESGLLVEVVEPGSPAELAGVQGGQLDLIIAGHGLLIGGDIVVEMNGQALKTPEQVSRAMRSLQVGESVRLKLFREGETREVKLDLPERPLLPLDLSGKRSALPLMRPSPSAARPSYRF
jgi:serine protease Do